MRKHIFTIMTIAATLCSCNKEVDLGLQTPEDVTSEAPFVFTATMESAPWTKATLDGLTPSLEQGDEVSINAKTYVAKNAGTSSTLVPQDGTASPGFYGFYEAVFPTSFAGWMSWGGSIDLITRFYPESYETWQEGKFAMPMYAKTSGNSFSFKNLCGVLKIIVKPDQIREVKAIKIYAGNQYLSGEVSIVQNADDSYKAVVKNDPAARHERKITYTTAVPTTPEGTVFYVAIPPNTFNGITIDLSMDGETFPVEMKTAAGRDIVIERNKIYPITFAGYAVNSNGSAKRTGEIDVNWTQLWENGPKWAEYNVGVTDSKAESIGGLYCRGKSIDKDPDNTYNHQDAVITGNDDTATNLWGSNWRMPTQAEFEALLANCDRAWTQINGVNGYKFTGRGIYASNSLFLPATGEWYLNQYIKTPQQGFYWSSSRYSGTSIYEQMRHEFFPAIVFGPSMQPQILQLAGDLGHAVRAVLK